MKPKIEYLVQLTPPAENNGNGHKRTVRAHYFLVSSNGDLIFFIVSPKFGDKKAISAFAAGTWDAVKENWAGNPPDRAKSFSDVPFLRDAR